MIKNFSIFKQDTKGNDKLPTHSISTNVGTQENPEHVTIGGCWTKEGNKGKFLSCKLSDTWIDGKDGGKSRRGYGIVAEPEEDHTAVDPKTGKDLNDPNSPF